MVSNRPVKRNFFTHSAFGAKDGFSNRQFLSNLARLEMGVISRAISEFQNSNRQFLRPGPFPVDTRTNWLGNCDKWHTALKCAADRLTGPTKTGAAEATRSSPPRRLYCDCDGQFPVTAVWAVAGSCRCLGRIRPGGAGRSISRSAFGCFRCGAVRGAAASAKFGGCGWRPIHLGRG